MKLSMLMLSSVLVIYDSPSNKRYTKNMVRAEVNDSRKSVEKRKRVDAKKNLFEDIPNESIADEEGGSSQPS